LAALASAKTLAHQKKTKVQEFLGASHAYKDTNDPGRKALIHDLKNNTLDAEGGLDAHKYAAKGGKEGRNPDYNVSWASDGSGKGPSYSRADGEKFNDGNVPNAEFSYKHPSTYPNVAGIAAAKGTSNPVAGGRRTRKMRGGWQTPERLKSLSKSKPIRTLTTRKRKKKRNKKTKKNKRRRKKRKRKKRKKSKRRR
jgi:hypothetical protein